MNRRDFLATSSATLATFALARPSAFAQNGIPQTAITPSAPLMFGTDYYPDQTPEHLWQTDAQQMAAFGITNVRIAEFAWALMEPAEGQFDFAWLKRACDVLHRHNIAIILGTPSAAPPNWLLQKYPEVLEVNDQGITLQPGTRRSVCPTNKTYRALSLKIATQMANTFTATPGVIGWQIDNEFTLGSSGRCYCKYCREGFGVWLLNKYKSLDAINAAWGDVFWSNTLTDISQVPIPLPSGAPPNPGMVLDYDRYQSFANASFCQEQINLLRSTCPSHWLTTNNVTISDSLDCRELYRNLDFVSSDNYPGFFSVVTGTPGESIPAEALAPTIAFSLDASRGARNGQPFFIMEQQSGKAGQPFFSPQPEPGQLRLWAWQAVAHGAFGINFFRWDTNNAAAEEYWHGILRHDRTPSPGFTEMKKTFAEMKSLGKTHLEANVEAASALIFDLPSDWALAVQPSQPKLKYLEQVITWYACASAAHTGLDIIDATQDLSRYKFVFAPAMYVVSPQQADRIRAFVKGGGTFVAGIRLGTKDEHSRIVDTALPGLLADVMGVELFDYQPIYSEKQSVKFTGTLAGPDAPISIWSDILTPKGAATLATYTTGQHAGRAAITTHAFGKGHAVYIGANLDGATLGRVLNTLLAIGGVRSPITAPQGVEVTTRRSSQGALTYLLNHTAQPQTVTAPGKTLDMLSSDTFTGPITLPPYGIRVLKTV